VDVAPAGRVVGALTSEVAVSVSNKRLKLKNCQEDGWISSSTRQLKDTNWTVVEDVGKAGLLTCSG
jgi:hypothetical protein